MNYFKTTIIAAAVGLALSESSFATPILVAEYPTGNSGDATELALMAQKIIDYNNTHNPDLPIFGTTTEFVAKTSSVSAYDSPDGQTIVWTAPSDYDYYYIMTKWGAGGASFDTALHYVLAGDILNYDPIDLNDLDKDNIPTGKPNGLSHVWIFGADSPVIDIRKVPDGGSTVVLMGAALTGLAMIRRRN